jgi:exonuclease SbcC
LTRQKTLQDDITTLQHKQVVCKQDIARYSSELASYTAQLQGEENLGLHLAVIEKQQLIAAKEQVLLQHERDCVELEAALQSKLSNSPYATIDEVRAALTVLHGEQELRQRYAEQVKDIETKTAEVAQLREQLNVQAAQAKVAFSPEEAEQELRSLAGKIADSNAEIRRLEKRLVEQQHAEQQYQTLQVQLKQSEEAAQPYLEEVQQITTEGNMAFRRRVQRHIIDQLLSHTNSLLEDLSGRYYLRHRASENGLALVIEDTYQAKNARRSLKTLSGGESFIVSLALALGLSKMASNGKSVDSLFLDEGFGNLDAENLYTVITTLENLHQQHGKTVGVISHVDAVQKRFKAQLQVIKKPNGRGVLRLV